MSWLRDNLGWFIAGGGIVAAGLIFLALRGVLGPKIALMVAGAFFALGQFWGALRRAREKGRAEAEERQRQANADAVARANAAREAARKRNQETGGEIDEDDKYLRD